MCVVDLDTVMPGCALYDFGDMVRTTTSPTMEDELDRARTQFRLVERIEKQEEAMQKFADAV